MINPPSLLPSPPQSRNVPLWTVLGVEVVVGRWGLFNLPPLSPPVVGWCGGRPSYQRGLWAWQSAACVRAAWDAPPRTRNHLSVLLRFLFPTGKQKYLKSALKRWAGPLVHCVTDWRKNIHPCAQHWACCLRPIRKGHYKWVLRWQHGFYLHDRCLSWTDSKLWKCSWACAAFSMTCVLFKIQRMCSNRSKYR